MKHVLLAITAHGLGHLAQTVEVARALRNRSRDMRITVRSAIAAEQIERRFGFPVEHVRAEDDFGAKNHPGFEIDLQRTHLAYEHLHRRWEAALDEACAQIGRVRPDLILANIGYVPLAAGARLGIPAFGLASLDWLTILRGYEQTRTASYLDDIAAAYGAAQGVFELTPASTDAAWRRRFPIGATAEAGRMRRSELRAMLGVAPVMRIVLCAFGGGVPPPPRRDFFDCPNTIFLAPPDWAGPSSVVSLDRLDWPFVDLVASADAGIAKLGYGIAAEAVRNGLPLLYHRRPGWAEDDALAAWLGTHGRAAEIDLARLDAAALDDALAKVMARARPLPAEFSVGDRFLSCLAAALA